MRRWRARNPELARTRTRESLRKWRAEKPEDYAAHNRKFREANRDLRSQQTSAWQRANPDKLYEKTKRYRAKNKDKVALWARLRRTVGEHTLEDVQRLLTDQGGLCLCGASLAEGYHVDHVLAVKRGGTGEADNLQLLCPPCNRSKGTKTMEEWSPILRRG